MAVRVGQRPTAHGGGSGAIHHRFELALLKQPISSRAAFSHLPPPADESAGHKNRWDGAAAARRPPLPPKWCGRGGGAFCSHPHTNRIQAQPTDAARPLIPHPTLHPALRRIVGLVFLLGIYVLAGAYPMAYPPKSQKKGTTTTVRAGFVSNLPSHTASRSSPVMMMN